MRVLRILRMVGFASCASLLLACRTEAPRSEAGGGEAATPPGASAAPSAPTAPSAAPSSSAASTSNVASRAAHLRGDGVDAGSASSTPGDGAPAVRFIGRFDMRDAAHPTCAWPGCRIVARFDGTQVTVRLDENVESWMTGGPSEWDVSVDGVARPKLVLTPGTNDYVLASDLPSGAHVVELYKRSEAQNGATQFLGYDFGGGALLPPPPRSTRTIEVVGDSQAAGYGVDGVGITCAPPQWAARYQNFHESFGAVLGATFGADVLGAVYSGIGIARNVWRADPDTMPILYQRANPIDPSSAQDMSSIAPDAILVVLGGNDFDIGQPTDDGPISLATFQAAYDGFVAELRADHPNAHLFLVTPPTVSDDAPPGRAARTTIEAAIHAIVALRTGAGDARIHYAEPSPATAAELTGCQGHGSPAYHQRVAGDLAAVVGPALGWN